MSKKDCEYYQEQLSALLDGELSETEQGELKNHIAGCESCSMLCVALAAADGALNAGLDPVPPDLHQRIMDRVEESSGTQRRNKLLRILRPALATAACVVIIAGTVYSLLPSLRAGENAEIAQSAADAAPAEAAAADMPSTAENGSAFDTLLPEEAPPEEAETEGQSAAASQEIPSGAAGKAAAASGGSSPMVGSSAPADTFNAVSGPEAPEAYAAAEVSQDAEPTAGAAIPEAEERSETAASENDAGSRPMFTMEVEVLSMDGETFIGRVVSDPSGHIAPGMQVRVQAKESAADGAQLAAGTKVSVTFDTMTAIPEGWMVSAETVEAEE